MWDFRELDIRFGVNWVRWEVGRRRREEKEGERREAGGGRSPDPVNHFSPNTFPIWPFISYKNPHS